MSGTPAGIAQLVEQLICNQQVGGSSPSTGSTQKQSEYGGIPEWPKGTDCKSAAYSFGGSNPPSPTNEKDIAFGGVFFVAESRIRTDLNPTGRRPVGKTSSQTGFLLIALPRKASNRIHLPPPNTRNPNLFPVGRWVRIFVYIRDISFRNPFCPNERFFPCNDPKFPAR